MNKLAYRMYGIVPYNLSPIQQGIQFGHAVVEYMMKYYDGPICTDECYDWSHIDKTFMVMNGGTTNNSTGRYGSMNYHLHELKSLDLNLATFYEPDLGDQLTAVVFLVDERVWDKDKYPDFSEWLYANPVQFSTIKAEEIDFDKTLEEVNVEGYKNWITLIGGEQNVKLREFISKLEFA